MVNSTSAVAGNAFRFPVSALPRSGHVGFPKKARQEEVKESMDRFSVCVIPKYETMRTSIVESKVGFPGEVRPREVNESRV